jgi:hypothetical protein
MEDMPMDRLFDMTEQEIIKILESDDCSAEDFVVLSKALFAKRGMSQGEWREIFDDQKFKEELRQYGLAEDLVMDVVASTIREKLGHNENITHCLRHDENRKPICTVCNADPHKAVTIYARRRNGNQERPMVIIAIVCEDHFRRIQIQDVQVLDTIREIATRLNKAD